MDQKISKKTVEEGEELEVQLCPFGEFPNVRPCDGEKVVQICDRKAFEQMVNAFTEEGMEVLVDLDHESESPTGGTEAAAWITKLRIDPENGLMGTMRFTDTGAKAVSSRRMTRLSPCWDMGEDGRPRKLTSVGLTNRPNIPVARLLNRAPARNSVQQKQKEPENMESIIAELGLAADATPEQVLEAVKALKAKLSEYETENAAREAEEAADKHAEQIADREEFKKAYLSNKELVTSLMNSLRKPQPSKMQPQKLVNSFAAKTPNLPGERDRLLEQLQRLPMGERDAFYNAHRDVFGQTEKLK